MPEATLWPIELQAPSKSALTTIAKAFMNSSKPDTRRRNLQAMRRRPHYRPAKTVSLDVRYVADGRSLLSLNSALPLSLTHALSLLAQNPGEDRDHHADQQHCGEGE